jgi:hypothetical protein
VSAAKLRNLSAKLPEADGPSSTCEQLGAGFVLCTVPHFVGVVIAGFTAVLHFGNWKCNARLLYWQGSSRWSMELYAGRQCVQALGQISPAFAGFFGALEPAFGFNNEWLGRLLPDLLPFHAV